MIDWSLAGQIARGVSGLQPSGDPGPFRDVAGPAAESERLVGAYTGLVADGPLPAAEAVDRGQWIDANLGSMRGVLEPAVEKARSRMGILGGAASGILAVEAGAISGFLGGRVLGQYEFPVLDPEQPARLLFVAPNLAHAGDQLEADSDQLLRWVALHETTHALQFGGVPWLREYLAGLVQELLDGLDVQAGGLFDLKLPDLSRFADLSKLTDVSRLRELADEMKDGGLISFGLAPERKELLARAQSFMALLEGYAEHVMDAVGADLLEDLPAMRSALERRRREKTGFLRVLERLIGMDLKMRQYEQGKAFCDAVVELGGIEALNRAWSGPEALPTMGELDDALAWLARTERLGLGPRTA
ncbi:MAG: hypothetical protein QOK21_1362 [Solirubrobacteraceae bacterium]|jgi:coenzyme F420 biosynthesis associated uncharacterized protein|nr:hypothetical protein [Solirubrobacteraceae bacterium]